MTLEQQIAIGADSTPSRLAEIIFRGYPMGMEALMQLRDDLEGMLMSFPASIPQVDPALVISKAGICREV